jgi:hypothetical protein
MNINIAKPPPTTPISGLSPGDTFYYEEGGIGGYYIKGDATNLNYVCTRLSDGHVVHIQPRSPVHKVETTVTIL